MHIAVLKESLPIIKMLVSEGAKCDVKDKESAKTPIEMAHGFNDSIYNYFLSEPHAN